MKRRRGGGDRRPIAPLGYAVLAVCFFRRRRAGVAGTRRGEAVLRRDAMSELICRELVREYVGKARAGGFRGSVRGALITEEELFL